MYIVLFIDPAFMFYFILLLQKQRTWFCNYSSARANWSWHLPTNLGHNPLDIIPPNEIPPDEIPLLRRWVVFRLCGGMSAYLCTATVIDVSQSQKAVTSENVQAVFLHCRHTCSPINQLLIENHKSLVSMCTTSHLWNKLPVSLRQPCSNHSFHFQPYFTPGHHHVHFFLFHSRLTTYPFHKSFPPQTAHIRQSDWIF